MNEEIRFASPESQYEGRGEVPADTEEIFWNRMSDDYDSRLKCGNLLARQYRYREAVEVYRKAERIRQDDPALYLRMGGALLTLFRFDEAAECYERARELGMEARKLAFYFGFREYLWGITAQLRNGSGMSFRPMMRTPFPRFTGTPFPPSARVRLRICSAR